jgi:hypothetical protein
MLVNRTFVLLLTLLLLLPLLMVGCAIPRSYSIIKRQSSAGVTNIYARVPPGTTAPKMLEWAEDITVHEDLSKESNIYFYDGPLNDDKNWVGTYRDGKSLLPPHQTAASPRSSTTPLQT